MEFEHEKDLIAEESQVIEEQAPSAMWERFVKQGIVCAILLITMLWLNRVAPDGPIGHIVDKFKIAIQTDSNSSFGFLRRQPFIEKTITWAKKVWSEMEEQPAATEEINLIPPVPGQILKKFGWISEAAGKEPVFHPGIDLEAPDGSPVRAGGRGTVQEIRQESDGLWRVTLGHDNNSRSIYANCNEVVVRIGESVEAGREIGKVGRGTDKVSIVHWEVWKGIQPVDPQIFLRMR